MKTATQDNKKSYFFKSEKGNLASVTFSGRKKPSKKVLSALSVMINLAFKELKLKK